MLGRYWFGFIEGGRYVYLGVVVMLVYVVVVMVTIFVVEFSSFCFYKLYM